jgi:ubiquinone/menaquinone biosynthesis C-methylase UbiE
MSIINYQTIVDPVFRDIRKCLPEFAGIKAGDRVVDVCCGTGAQVIEYGRQGVVATGIDSSPGMMALAASAMRKQRLANISFQLADAASLPFPDGCFDYASVTLGLHDKEKPVRDQVVSEMKRVVRRDGALVLVDFSVPLPGNFWAVFARVIEFFAGGAHYLGFKNYCATGGMPEIMKNHGLRAERTVYLKNGLMVAVKAKPIKIVERKTDS